MNTACLIIPPSVFLLDERVFVSLGILRVAAVLERAGHRVGVLAMFEALKLTDTVVDADVPKGRLFLTDSSYDSLPLAAHHLPTCQGSTPTRCQRLAIVSMRTAWTSARWRSTTKATQRGVQDVRLYRLSE